MMMGDTEAETRRVLPKTRLEREGGTEHTATSTQGGAGISMSRQQEDPEGLVQQQHHVTGLEFQVHSFYCLKNETREQEEM